jgi:hypothetical protein
MGKKQRMLHTGCVAVLNQCCAECVTPLPTDTMVPLAPNAADGAVLCSWPQVMGDVCTRINRQIYETAGSGR